ncbi:HSF-type DNA-binding-domain-containing protein [Zychaea mexicana]|uniref:HSF-type DNA-binding-domain-containing protein n=1 Tax=Zychaea mexicana TaxID=64656 RepID=UPI0022FE8BBC|nr:HSF-type DNA-binding-domain-containing protein [Zychaea mexicana]KAI9498700.1 HSF-type DNA-binding-domain-containing protein [Zychaea mexicana]
MQHGRTPSASSWTPHSVLSNNGGSVSSGSPINSPHASPLHSPYASPSESPREQLHNQFARQMSLQPPTTTATSTQQSQQQSSSTASSSSSSKQGSSGNTFVHKLYNMVVDKQYQHLIAWTYTGTSFIVCNITEFSRDVLPKHFKHNNFSSFVRQLNMYGFHKVNKSPRGHRALAENQIWEFSHPKFLRGRGDMLDEIKRKALESDVVRRDNGDISSHLAVMQVAQSDMMQQLAHLQENFSEIVRELADTRRRQMAQQQLIKQMLDYLTHQQGAPLQVPSDFNFDGYNNIKPDPEQQPPPIYITSPDTSHHHQQMQNMYLGSGQEHSPSPSPPPQPHTPPLPPQQQHHHPHQQQQHIQQQHIQQQHIQQQQQHIQHQQQHIQHQQQQHQGIPSRPAVPLTVQTQNLQQSTRLHISPTSVHTIESAQSSPQQQQLTPHQLAIQTPLPPSPSPTAFLSDDEAASLYSPHSPHTPSVMTHSNSSGHLATDGFGLQTPSGLNVQQLGYNNMQS